MQIIEKIYPLRFDRGGKAPASTISAALASAPLSPPLSNHGSSPQPFSVSCFIIIWFSLRGMVTSGLFRARIFLPVLCMAYEASILYWACGFAARNFTEFFTIANRAKVAAKFLAHYNDFSLELYMEKTIA